MGDLGKGIGKAVGSVADAIGLRDVIRRDKPRKGPSIALPDEDAISMEARRKRARQALRSGRVSTILEDGETLG